MDYEKEIKKMGWTRREVKNRIEGIMDEKIDDEDLKQKSKKDDSRENVADVVDSFFNNNDN
ncbi:hypothetical protein [Staphylococcus kloosii]|jgi:hypothetical protein|uniref:Uncharacterized protein n=1 Tax=Staphylococcus kloosii TaxID=29384 RepID=A0ABQ0XI78_9STAP|nr:hypothetical protein [Staphylococcus kloosii]AVQ35857.1 hypothetical protein C7J89_06870 [Staphylococcus kloosii]MBF7021747.1 hypothetical protein [Staphylococcus kloosii]PNZ01126.1 hypothetical protein CD136_13185 [Staphylococcus kloosii]PTJ70072.1 hypothetical protein BUZ59_13505 [Staphylococcus kloosii]SUM48928.1 Uncharacterised protein [Staphylococcus kloosii]